MYKPALKPCPFCGGEAGSTNNSVFCYECYATMHAKTDLMVLVDLWNIRAQTIDECPAPVQKLINERGAGRKPKISNIDKQLILDSVSRGSSYRSTAHYFKVSVGTVHKLINEHKKKGRA